MEGMSLIVKTTDRWIMGFVIVFGSATVLYGHLSPGGGFAGGVILASAFVLWFLAHGGRGRHKDAKEDASVLDVVGAFAFLGLAFAGFISGVFFINFIQKSHPGADFTLFSAGVIPLMNIAIALKVAASLFLAFLILAALRIPEGGGSEDELSTLEEME